VWLLGDRRHDECLMVMARSRAFVRPTRADGDSISVREALALQVPTVASDAAPRPEGTHLFAAGDVDDLVRAVEDALSSRPPSGLAATDTLPRLVDLYAADSLSRKVLAHARALLRG
jgi:glycosyltransferase involved in cell wall biosynthesis